MKLRKKHLKIGMLILLGLCVLSGIVLGICFLFFHKEKSEPEPPYTTLISEKLQADLLTGIVITDNRSGDIYTFDSDSACTVLLRGLQAVHLYREKNPTSFTNTDAYTITLEFSEDSVCLSLKDGFCRNANGTVYDCGKTAQKFLTVLTQQIEEQTYSKAENNYSK